MTGGRPLRFLAMTLGGWTALRVVMLWPSLPAVPELVRAVGNGVIASAEAATVEPGVALPGWRQRLGRSPVLARVTAGDMSWPASLTPAAPAPAGGRMADPKLVALVAAALVRYGASMPLGEPPQAIDAPRPPAPTGPDRWAASAWLLARGGSSGTLAGGQLGASQAGVRVTYALDERRRLAVAGRVATPLSGHGREAAIGLDWQPTAAPIHLVAEERIALDRGRGGPTLGVIGGYGPGPVAAGFDLETYAQAGAIARDRVEGFVDAAARVTRPVRVAGVTLAVGAGAWGSAQRGAARLDVGPSVGVAVPVAGRRLRLAVDWRQRVAGDAHPGSGPALSIGSDF